MGLWLECNVISSANKCKSDLYDGFMMFIKLYNWEQYNITFPFLFILDLYPAPVKSLDVRKTHILNCLVYIISPWGAIMVPVTV